MITYPTYFLDVQGIDYIINFVHIFFEVILVSNINKESGYDYCDIQNNSKHTDDEYFSVVFV